MKHYQPLLFILVAFFFQNCTYNAVPLKGSYQKGPVKTKVDLSFEKAWEKSIDMIAATGMSVKLIDKASGLIIGESSSFWGLVTIEDKKGKILNPDYYIVRERTPPERTPFPYNAIATWNLRVKSIQEQSTVISVNLHSIKIEKPLNAITFRGVSTGNFEKWLIDEIVREQ